MKLYGARLQQKGEIVPRDIAWEWKATGWYVEPRNAREVMNVVGAIGVYSIGQRFAWRGMSSADYTLISSLQRKLGNSRDEEALREAELETLRKARAWGLGVQPTGHVDDLQLLSDLQHYGIATRLLDFTSNPMTALWFACQAPNGDVAKSGLLVAMNTKGWPTYSTVGAANLTTWGQQADPAGARLRSALSGGAPFLVESANPNERLRAQEGFFVASAAPGPRKSTQVPLAGTSSISHLEIIDISPFDALKVEYPRGNHDELYKRLTEERQRGRPSALPFVAVIIRANLKPKLLRYLESTYNRSARVLFPDYAGFLEYGEAPHRPE